jgi:hypothetical protein
MSDWAKYRMPAQPVAEIKVVDARTSLVPRAGGPIAEIKVTKAPTEQRREGHHVQVPMPWVERLADAKHLATVKLALWILYLNWKRRGRAFLLSNNAIALSGVRKQRKADALLELEELGLISADRRPKKAPLITVHLIPRPF